MIIGTEFLSRQNHNIEFLREYFDYALKNNFNEIDTNTLMVKITQ